MPMTLNIGLSRKIGQPDYGSLGASCHVEVELDGSLIRDDLEKFHTHVKNAFIACRQAVQDELARHHNGGGGASSNDEPHANGSSNGTVSGGHTGNGHFDNGHASNTGASGAGSVRNGSVPAGNARNGGNRNAARPTGSRRTNQRRATVSQVRAIHAIANRLGLDLVAELRERFHVDQPDELSISDASRLIDDLKAAPAGAEDRR